jgi:hypothetical protein
MREDNTKVELGLHQEDPSTERRKGKYYYMILIS